MTVTSSIPGPETYKLLLEQISAKASRYGESLQPPCDAKAVDSLRLRAREQLRLEIPPGYAEFLMLHNGLDWDGLVIYASETCPISGYVDRFIEGLVESNLGFRDNARMKRFLVLGDSGLELYVYEPEENAYSTIERVSLERNQSFASFSEMLAAALRSRMS
jgi:hypothetical protein